jgi:hypothetical protein
VSIPRLRQPLVGTEEGTDYNALSISIDSNFLYLERYSEPIKCVNINAGERKKVDKAEWWDVVRASPFQAYKAVIIAVALAVAVWGVAMHVIVDNFEMDVEAEINRGGATTAEKQKSSR